MGAKFDSLLKWLSDPANRLFWSLNPSFSADDFAYGSWENII